MTISNNKLLMGAAGAGGGQTASNYLAVNRASQGTLDVLDHTTPGSISSNDTLTLGGGGNDGYCAAWASDDSFIVANTEGNPHLHLIDSSNYGSLSSSDNINVGFRSRSLALSPGDDQVAVGHWDGSGNWRLYQISSGSLSLASAEVLPNGTSGGSVESIDYNPDGDYIAILARPASGNSFIHLYSVPTNNAGAPSFIASYDGGSGGGSTGTCSCRFSPDGNYLAVSFLSKLRVFTYNSSSITLLATQSIIGTGYFQSIAWNPDNSEIAVTATGNKRLHIYLFDPTHASEENRLIHADSSYLLPGTPNGIAWSADGEYIAAVSAQGLDLVNAGAQNNLSRADRIASSGYYSNGDRISWSNN